MIAVLIDNKGFQNTMQLPTKVPEIKVAVYGKIKLVESDGLDIVPSELTNTEVIFKYEKSAIPYRGVEIAYYVQKD